MYTCVCIRRSSKTPHYMCMCNICLQSWIYLLGGLIIYTIERIVRFVRGLRKVVIIKVVEHPSKTIEIQMRSKGFFADAGQYVFVNVPSVAFFEWHPFTLTSVSGTHSLYIHDIVLIQQYMCMACSFIHCTYGHM